jgi:hypothetical protein
MSNEKKPFTGVSLIIGLNNKDDADKAEPIQKLAFFAPKADAKVLHSADKVSEEDRAPAKFVAFPSPTGFDIVESTAYAEAKKIAGGATPEAAKGAKGLKIGVVFAHHYTNGEGKAGVLYSGGFNPAGIAKDAKISDQPFRALGSFTGTGAEPIAKASADVMAAAKVKREAKKGAEAGAGDNAPEAPAPAAKPTGPALAF